jgi:hypothetical protein
MRFVQLLQAPEGEQGGRAPALAYARRHLAPFAGTQLAEIQRLMGCLLFANRLQVPPSLHGHLSAAKRSSSTSHATLTLL